MATEQAPATRRVEIKRRYTDAVLFAADVPSDTPSGLQMRVALEQATEAGAYLAGANLAGAYLAGANLAGAYLARANLADADLAGANLADAYLAGADLAGAYLAGADLAGADLARADLARANLARANLARANLARANLAGAYLADADLAGADLARADLAGAYLAGAYLARAKLSDNLTLIGRRPLLQIGPIGSRHATLHAYITSGGVYLRAGCFFGTRDEFAAAVEREHGANAHGDEYRAALVLIDVHARLWTPAEQAEAA